jgi:20S proteasome alpha/beta subunit
MTLNIALEGSDGLILATDSRGTIGDPRGLTAVNDIQKKLFKLTDYSGITIAGSSELAATLIDKLMKQIQNTHSTDDIANLASNFMKQEYQSWFGVRQWVTTAPVIDNRPFINFILAGYNKTTGGGQPRIYLINSQMDFVSQLCPSGYMLAGIPQYATYLLHRFYDRRMTIKNLTSLAAYLITETATQDPKVGGPIRMAQITPGEGFKELEEAVITDVVKRNEEQNQKLRQFFFKEA